MIEQLASERTPPIPFEEIWPDYRAKQTMFRARLEETAAVSCGNTLDMIRDLRRIYKLAVVSSSGRSEVEPPIERAGIRPCFQAFVCGREVPNLKPAPDPYLRAAELLGSPGRWWLKIRMREWPAPQQPDSMFCGSPARTRWRRKYAPGSTGRRSGARLKSPERFDSRNGAQRGFDGRRIFRPR